MSLARLFAALPLWGFLVPVLAAQQQAEPPAARIQVSVNEVIVPITVTDDKGRFVSNLEAKDFRILDEGRPQRIRFFSHDQNQPIVVGFLIDMSNNTRVHWSGTCCRATRSTPATSSPTVTTPRWWSTPRGIRTKSPTRSRS
jgi:hypothetical protein